MIRRAEVDMTSFPRSRVGTQVFDAHASRRERTLLKLLRYCKARHKTDRE